MADGSAMRPIGRRGPAVSAVGLGCSNFGTRVDGADAERLVHGAVDLGVTLFDVADNYGKRQAEQVLGAALGSRRKHVILATKFGSQMDDAGKLKGASRGYVMAAVEASLKRLNTDWIDLYQLHHPDPDVPLDETLRALDDLTRQGKIRFAGCSNLPAAQIAEAAGTARAANLTGFVACQDEYSLLARDAEADLIPAIREADMGLLPYMPLAGGLLTGRFEAGMPPPPDTRLAVAQTLRMKFKFMRPATEPRVEALRALARQSGRRFLELAIGWLLSRPVVACVVAGASKVEQVAANVAAARVKLTQDELDALDRCTA